MVNLGHATAKDVRELIAIAQQHRRGRTAACISSRRSASSASSRTGRLTVRTNAPNPTTNRHGAGAIDRPRDADVHRSEKSVMPRADGRAHAVRSAAETAHRPADAESSGCRARARRRELGPSALRAHAQARTDPGMQRLRQRRDRSLPDVEPIARERSKERGAIAGEFLVSIAGQRFVAAELEQLSAAADRRRARRRRPRARRARAVRNIVAPTAPARRAANRDRPMRAS